LHALDEVLLVSNYTLHIFKMYANDANDANDDANDAIAIS